MLGWGVATFDGLYTLQSLVRTKTTGADGSFNLGRISDPKLDNTIDAIKIATDPVARDALLREGLAEDARRGVLRAAAPPDAALGDEEERHASPTARTTGRRRASRR